MRLLGDYEQYPHGPVLDQVYVQVAGGVSRFRSDPVLQGMEQPSAESLCAAVQKIFRMIDRMSYEHAQKFHALLTDTANTIHDAFPWTALADTPANERFAFTVREKAAELDVLIKSVKIP
jgi:hypothetical protein